MTPIICRNRDFPDISEILTATKDQIKLFYIQITDPRTDIQDWIETNRE